MSTVDRDGGIPARRLPAGALVSDSSDGCVTCHRVAQKTALSSHAVVVRTPEVYLDANDPETQDLTRVCRPVTRGLDIIRKLRIITR
jgi:hypothetical protein